MDNLKLCTNYSLPASSTLPPPAAQTRMRKRKCYCQLVTKAPARPGGRQQATSPLPPAMQHSLLTSLRQQAGTAASLAAAPAATPGRSCACAGRTRWRAGAGAPGSLQWCGKSATCMRLALRHACADADGSWLGPAHTQALILIKLFPMSLRLVSVFGLLDNVVRLAFGSLIGQYVDRCGAEPTHTTRSCSWIFRAGAVHRQ